MGVVAGLLPRHGLPEPPSIAEDGQLALGFADQHAQRRRLDRRSIGRHEDRPASALGTLGFGVGGGSQPNEVDLAALAVIDGRVVDGRLRWSLHESDRSKKRIVR